MAETEVFRADLQINIFGDEDGEEKLKGLSIAVDKVVKSLEKLSKTRVSFQGIEKQVGNLKKNFKGIGSDAGNLGGLNEAVKKTVGQVNETIKAGLGKNPIPDIVFDIATEFKTLPNKISPEVEKLKSIFSELRRDIKSQDVATFDRATAGLVDLQQSLSQLKTDQIDKVKQSMENAETASLSFTQNLKRNILEVDKPVQLISANTVRFSDRLRGLGTLAFGSGRKLQGFREVLAGTASSENLLIKATDKLIRRNNDLLRDRSRLEKSFIRQNEQTLNATTVFKDQIDSVRQLAKVEGKDAVDAVGRFDSQVTKLVASLKQVDVTARQGGDASVALGRAGSELQELRRTLTSIQQQGIIDPTKESAEQFAILQKTVKSLGVDLDATTSRHRSVKNEVVKAKDAEKARKEETKKTAQAVGNLQTKSKGLFSTIAKVFKKEPPEQFARSVDKAGRSMQEVGSNARRLQVEIRESFGRAVGAEFLGNIFAKLTLAVGQAFGRLVREVPRQLISLASSAEETRNRFDAVFDNMSDKANEFAENVGKSVGRNVNAIREGLASFQSFAVGLDFAGEQGFQFSAALQKLSIDFASFNNLSDQKAAQKFLSGLSGSTEVFDKYGINLRVAALQQEFLSLGINKTVAEATEQEKAFARLSIIKRVMGEQGAIGDAITTAGGFANQTKRLTDRITELATGVGQKLLPALAPFLRALNLLVDFLYPKVIALSEKVFATLQPLGAAFEAALSGDLTGFNDAIDTIFETMLGLLRSAFDWGVGLMGNLSDGIISAANSVIDSVIGIADEIFGFLAPGSPPERGPLSDIDKWGGGLMDVYSAGFDDFNTDFLAKIADDVKSALSEDVLPEAGTLIKQINERLRETGALDEGAFSRLKELLGEDNKLLADSIKASADYEGSRQNLVAIEQELLQARILGKDTTDIENRLKAAKSEFKFAQRTANQKEEELKFAKKFQKTPGATPAGGPGGDATLDEELKAVQERADLGIITAEEAERAKIGILKKFAEKSRKDGNKERARTLAAEAKGIQATIENKRKAEKDAASAKRKSEAKSRKSERDTRKKAERKTAEQVRDEAITILDQQLAAGIISQEDFAKAKLRIEKKFFTDTVKEGKNATDENIANIKRLESEVQSFKKSGGIAGGGLAEGLFDQLGFDEITSDISTAFAERIPIAFDEAKAKIKSKIKEMLGGVREFLGSSEGINSIVNAGWVLGIFNRVKSIITGGGFIGKILKPFTPLVAIVDKISEPFLKVIKVIGDLLDNLGPGGKLLKKFLGTAAGLTGPIGILITLWANWDTIVLAFNETVDFFRGIWDGIIERLGGSESTLEKFKKFWEGISLIFSTIKDNLVGFFAKIIEGDIGGAFESLLSVEGLDLTSFTSLGAEIAGAIWDSVTEATGTAIQGLINFIAGALPEPLRLAIEEHLGPLPEVAERVKEAILTAGTAIKNAFGPAFELLVARLRVFADDIRPRLVLLGEKIEVLWGRLKVAFAELALVWTEKLEPAFTRLLVSLGLMDEDSEGFGITFDQLVTLIVNLGLDKIIDGITFAIDALVVIIDTFAVGLAIATPFISAAAEKIATFLDRVSLITTTFTSVFNTATKLITTFVDGPLNKLIEGFNNLTDFDFSFGMSGFSLPGFASGTFNVPQDMLAVIHKGEMIIPSSIAADIRGGVSSLPQNITNNNASGIEISIGQIVVAAGADPMAIGDGIGAGIAGRLRSEGLA